MNVLDYFNYDIISLENAKKFLNEKDYKNFCEMDETLRVEMLKSILEKPIDDWTIITELYFRSKWSELFNTIYLNKEISILEVASGDADIIPQTLSVSNKYSEYMAANMNKILNESLIRKTKNLNIKLNLIDDDAANIKNYINKNSVDIIAFQHGVNDVLQAILCDIENIDTINCEWMDCLPKMIELIKNEVENNTFEENLKDIFINFISDLSYVLKDDGIIAINHYMFKLDLDLGYPKEIFEMLIPIIRSWFKESNCLEETYFENFDTQWWIFLKKKI